MGTDFVGLVEVEERDTWGAAARVVEMGAARRCACGAVRLGDEIVHDESGCRPMRMWVAPGREPFPAPLVTSRDPWDGVTGAPSAVLKLAERAVAASWTVGVQRSRGQAPHASHGAPGVLKWRYAVKLRNADANAYAVHDGTAWKSVMLWGAARPWFALASLTDLDAYILAGGSMSDEWYDAIRARIRDADARKRVASRTRPKTAREGMS